MKAKNAKRENEWLTPQQAAEELRLHVRTVLNQIKNKTLHAAQFGRQYRIPREALDRLKNAQEGGQEGV